MGKVERGTLFTPPLDAKWGRASELVPEMKLMVQVPGQEPEEPFLLRMIEQDSGDTFFFLFDETGRQNLLQQMTGGVVLPSIRDGIKI